MVVFLRSKVGKHIKKGMISWEKRRDTEANIKRRSGTSKKL